MRPNLNLLARLGFVASLAALGACAPSKEEPARPAASSPAGPPGVSGKAPPGAIVTLDPVPARDFPLPQGPAILDQYSKQFVPGLLIVRVGQAVEFRNSDEFGHNVIVNRRSTGGAVFNTSLDTQQVHTHVFERAGEYAVTCDLHPGMLATVFATATPFTAQVGPSGTYAISDVPLGPYKVTLVLSGGGLKEQTVTVSSPRTELNLTP